MAIGIARAFSSRATSQASTRRTAYDVPPLGSAELRRVDVRVHGSLSAALGLLAIALAPLAGHSLVLVVAGALAMLSGAVHLLVDPGRFSANSLTLGQAAAVVSVMLCSGASGHSADLTAGPILCVIATIHAACFRAARETWLFVGWCVLTYAVLLTFTTDTLRTVGGTCVLAATLVPIAFTLTWLRQRIDMLVLELHRQADHDALTGLLNREGLRRRADDDAAAATSSGGLHALFLLDVDRFKSLNDELGHPAGDAALAWLGQHLRSCVRDPAVVARYGGEEFVVLLPIDSLRSAGDRARDLRRSVESAGLTLPRPLTVSIGVAVGSSDGDFYELYERADLALYAAKASGRNRVAVSGLDPVDDSPWVAGTVTGGSTDRPAEAQVA